MTASAALELVMICERQEDTNADTLAVLLAMALEEQPCIEWYHWLNTRWEKIREKLSSVTWATHMVQNIDRCAFKVLKQKR